MGIMGNFLDSNFSLDVVTRSPWDEQQNDQEKQADSLA